jgi:mannose/fructose-specific phosphotransferase system component IIA
MATHQILVVGHGDFPEALLASARLICGSLSHVSTLGLQPEESPSAFRERVLVVYETQAPHLIITDLVGGTPDNVIGLLSKQFPSKWILAGVSLPLLIELAMCEEEFDLSIIERALDISTGVLRHRSEETVTQ